MLPTMRYQTSKLTQLYHQKRVYKQHQQVLNKIKNRSAYQKNTQKPRLNISVQRIQHLEELKNRFSEHFNHTQSVRGKEIYKGNVSLYQKVFSNMNNRRSSISQLQNNSKRSITSDNQKLIVVQDFRNLNEEALLNPQKTKKMVLRNHRQSPVNKSTALDRKNQNLRLASRISKPSPTINTRNLQKMHIQQKKLKERIMKYGLSTPKFLSYLDKKFSSATSFTVNKGNKSLGFDSPKTSQNRYEFCLTQYDPQ